LIIFPSEASFEKVKQAAGGRTYVLKFTSSNQRHFFWLQDASTDRDSQITENVNNLLQDPSFTPVWEDESAGPTQPQASTSATAAPPTDRQLSELRNILSQISQNPGATGAQAPELSLADVLTPANLAPLFSSPDLVRSIFPYLPPDLPVPPSAEVLQRIIESPQFHAAVRSLDQALATGLLGGLVRGLGLPEEAGMGVGPFLRAIREQAQREASGSSSDGGNGGDSMEMD